LDVILHIGAHRTGTTTLQRFLNTNRGVLKANGIAFWGPGKTRGGLFTGLIKAPDKLTRDDHRRARRARGLIAIEISRLEAQGFHTLIVSEENMNGGLTHCAKSGVLYPQAWARMSRVAEAFQPHPTRVALAIRSYERHWGSVLAFCLKQGHAPPNAAALHAMTIQPRRWSHLVSDLAMAFPDADRVVWPFEALIGLPEVQLSALLGRKLDLRFQATREWHHSSLPQEELRKLLHEQGAPPEVLSRLGFGSGRWLPFSETQNAKMRLDYAEDLTWLRAGADGLASYIEGPEDIEGSVRPGRGLHYDERKTGVG